MEQTVKTDEQTPQAEIQPVAEAAPAEAVPAEATPAAAPQTEAAAAEVLPPPTAGAAGSASLDAAREALEGEEIRRVQYPPVEEGPVGQPLGNLDYLRDVNLEAGVELGNTTMSVEQILKLGVGSIVELNQTVGEPVRLLNNNNLDAQGEVVVIGDKFGVRIAKLMHSSQGSAE
jgi:flagellar motor switch protein FliN